MEELQAKCNTLLLIICPVKQAVLTVISININSLFYMSWLTLYSWFIILLDELFIIDPANFEFEYPISSRIAWNSGVRSTAILWLIAWNSGVRSKKNFL